MAADRMAKELLGIATDTNVPEGVRLAAVKDALDRAGLAAKTAVEVEVSTKPFELVFDSLREGHEIPKRRHPRPWNREAKTMGLSKGRLTKILYPKMTRSIREANTNRIPLWMWTVADEGYTDQIMNPAPTTPPREDLSASEPHSLSVGPPPFGMLSLEQAVEQAALMRSRANIRSARRR